MFSFDWRVEVIILILMAIAASCFYFGIACYFRVCTVISLYDENFQRDITCSRWELIDFHRYFVWYIHEILATGRWTPNQPRSFSAVPNSNLHPSTLGTSKPNIKKASPRNIKHSSVIFSRMLAEKIGFNRLLNLLFASLQSHWGSICSSSEGLLPRT